VKESLHFGGSATSITFYIRPIVKTDQRKNASEDRNNKEKIKQPQQKKVARIPRSQSKKGFSGGKQLCGSPGGVATD